MRIGGFRLAESRYKESNLKFFESVNILHPPTLCVFFSNRQKPPNTSRFIELGETTAGTKTPRFLLVAAIVTKKSLKKLNLVSFAGRVVKKYAKLLDIIIIAKLSSFPKYALGPIIC